jgi:hypothetical protein
MTAINLPGQLGVCLVIDHQAQMKRAAEKLAEQKVGDTREIQIAKLLRQYEERPTSETWSRIQALAAEILK